MENLIRCFGVSRCNYERWYLKKCDKSKIITSGSDVMNYLIRKGLSQDDAFMIMQFVRIGFTLEGNELDLMRSSGVEEWFISGCANCKYLSSRSDNIGLIKNIYTLTWYMVNYPEKFKKCVDMYRF